MRSSDNAAISEVAATNLWGASKTERKKAYAPVSAQCIAKVNDSFLHEIPVSVICTNSRMLRIL
jgi:hypothetical protein